MFRTTATALILTLFSAVGSAAAAEPDQNAVAVSGVVGAAMPTLLASATLTTPLASDVDWSLAPVDFGARRGAVLPVLYASLAGLNAYDAYSTTKGLSKGATESNPLMRGAAGNPAAIWAIKAGITTGAVVVSERLWRSNKRVQAITLMIVSNSMMTVVAARNASVLHRQ